MINKVLAIAASKGCFYLSYFVLDDLVLLLPQFSVLHFQSPATDHGPEAHESPSEKSSGL